jgi:hypothetical protein
MQLVSARLKDRSLSFVRRSEGTRMLRLLTKRGWFWELLG